MTILLILLGLSGLWLGTRWIINGSMAIAARFGLSHSFVGVAILAVGTDLPEVFVSVSASVKTLKGIESSGIIAGNALGSSISQISLILGAAAVLLKFQIGKKEFIRDGLALLTSILLLAAFGRDGTVTRWEGATLLCLYVIYYVFLLKDNKVAVSPPPSTKSARVFSIFLHLLLGFVILILASHLVVDNALSQAEQWGVAQSFVGVVIVGVGTSLPELAVSVGAAIKRSGGLSVGNIIGSNVFDGLIPIGLGGLISEMRIDRTLLEFDLPVLLLFTVTAFLFLYSKRGFSRIEGTVMMAMFIGYVILKRLLFAE